MSLRELGREALRAIRAHTLRSFLTLLGIIVGVATLVGVVSVITGLNAYVRERIIQLAPDVFVVQKFGVIRSRDEFLAALKRRNIDWGDYQSARAHLTLAETVAADASGTSVVKRGSHRLTDVRVHGTTANYGPLMRLDITAGRFFTPGEEQAALGVAVIGWDVKDELFPTTDPIGRMIKVGNKPYRVIGLLRRQGRQFGQSQDQVVLTPLSSFQKSFARHRSVDIFVEAANAATRKELEDAVRVVLRARVTGPYWRRRFHHFGEGAILHRPTWVYGPQQMSLGAHSLVLHGTWLSVESQAWDDMKRAAETAVMKAFAVLNPNEVLPPRSEAR